ncbi:protein disulfide-isomerase A6-like [Prorops nasuta]|uniref:protein disulfide-isomerase A6-like n=1 Tax=Prorops nasuta TaxID=863751 RepID=UPI0034CF212B
MKEILGLLLILIIGAYSEQKFYNNPNIIELDVNNFNDKVIKSSNAWVVEFYSPYCPNCQNFKPHFEAAARKLSVVFKVGAVDITKNRPLAVKYRVERYPVIKIFRADKNHPEHYNGQLTANALVATAFNG